MTHFVCMVLLPGQPESGDDLSKTLDELLEPFNENNRVDPYKEHVPPAPEGWEVAVANTDKFKALKEAGVEHREAWRQVWGEKNTDPQIEWPRDYARREGGIHPNDDAAVAAWYNKTCEDPDERYFVDENGLFCWSTYNPESEWDWWVLGGRWTGMYVPKTDAKGFVGEPGLLTSPATDGVDCIMRGDVDTEAMLRRQMTKIHESYQEAKTGKLRGHPPFLGGLLDDGETIEDYGMRLIESWGLPWQSYAILAEGVWRNKVEYGKKGRGVPYEDQEAAYTRFFAEFWEKMDPSTWIAAVDCHI